MSNKNTLKAGTINTLQKYVANKIKERGFEDETIHERLVLLMEEVGELAKACRKISGMNIDLNRDIKYKVGEEITDVINMTFAVGIKLNINIEKEFFDKERKNDKRIYGRSNSKQL